MADQSFTAGSVIKGGWASDLAGGDFRGERSYRERFSAGQYLIGSSQRSASAS
jgi:hypothetical protein